MKVTVRSVIVGTPARLDVLDVPLGEAADRVEMVDRLSELVGPELIETSFAKSSKLVSMASRTYRPRSVRVTTCFRRSVGFGA